MGTIWILKFLPLLWYCLFCDRNMDMMQRYLMFVPTNFKDDDNKYDVPYPDIDGFLNHIKEFSVNLNGCMNCRYHCWLFFFLYLIYFTNFIRNFM